MISFYNWTKVITTILKVGGCCDMEWTEARLWTKCWYDAMGDEDFFEAFG